jgi:hypothetical protein
MIRAIRSDGFQFCTCGVECEDARFTLPDSCTVTDSCTVPGDVGGRHTIRPDVRLLHGRLDVVRGIPAACCHDLECLLEPRGHLTNHRNCATLRTVACVRVSESLMSS